MIQRSHEIHILLIAIEGIHIYDSKNGITANENILLNKPTEKILLENIYPTVLCQLLLKLT